MRYLIFLSATFLVLLVAESLSADQADDKAQILEAVKSYVAAYNNRDAKALAAHWSAHGVYQNPLTGTEVSGREAIEREFAAVLKESEGAKLEAEVFSVEFLSPSVAVEQGIARIKSEDSDSDFSEYSAIHVKSGDNWLLDRVTENEIQLEPSHYEHLKSLEWLIGSWVDEDPEVRVETNCEWAKNQNFLTRTFVVEIVGETNLSGVQIIGWDASTGKIRSWAFDSDGGFVEGTWINKGDRWIVESSAVLPDGRTASSINIMKKIDDNTLAWQITGRDVDGELLPNLPEIKITRNQTTK